MALGIFQLESKMDSEQTLAGDSLTESLRKKAEESDLLLTEEERKTGEDWSWRDLVFLSAVTLYVRAIKYTSLA